MKKIQKIQHVNIFTVVELFQAGSTYSIILILFLRPSAHLAPESFDENLFSSPNVCRNTVADTTDDDDGRSGGI